MRDSIYVLLQSIYPEHESHVVRNGINELWQKYSSNHGQAGSSLSEKDVVLITYGDQVYDNENSGKLSTLRHFLTRHLNDIVTIIHILPFYPYSSDDGFSVQDFYTVRNDLGDWDDIHNFSNSFDLMFDAVINHMSSESEWFNGYVSDNKNYDNYFIDGSNFRHLEKVVRPRTSPLTHDFGEKNVWTTFSRDQIDLNYANSKVLIQMLDVLLFYVSKGAKIIRLDAVGFLWKKDNSTCIHLHETHAIIKIIRLVIDKIAPGVLLVTETNVPHIENISYFGNGDEAHMVYNFTLPPLLAFSLLNETTTKLQEWAGKLELRHEGTCFFNFLSSHDGVGLRPVDGILEHEELQTILDAAQANGGKVSYRHDKGLPSPYEVNCNYFSLLHGVESDKGLAIKRTLLAHAILLSFPGLPAIYFHSIFGQENDLKGLENSGYNRAINRQKFTLDNIEKNIRENGSSANMILRHIGQLIRVKQSHPQFHPLANFEIPFVEDGLLCIKKWTKTDPASSLYTYFNLSGKTRRIILPEPSNDILNDNDRSITVDELKPYDFAWYRSHQHH